MRLSLETQRAKAATRKMIWLVVASHGDLLTSAYRSGRRTYTLYIMYSPYYRTPRLYMSGYMPNGQPLPPHLMMEDIVGDYKDKTVTLEDFPFFANNIKMASVHPCKHAPVMKTLLDRADAALKIRREKLKAGIVTGDQGMEGLVDEINKLDVSGAEAAADKASENEWEEVQHEPDDQEVAIRVDQYLVVFLKVNHPRNISFTEIHGNANRYIVYCKCHAWY